MKNTMLATAMTAVLALAATDAYAQSEGTATKAELEAMRAQMMELAERLNRLEAANTTLATENAELKASVERRDAETDYLKSQARESREEAAVASNELAKVKGADWATKIKLRGDLRYRHENIAPERVVSGEADDAAKRDRQRIRARLGFDAKVTDNVKATLLLATGSDDPRSSNQTLGSNGTRKSIGVDMAYVDWQFVPGGNVVLGKQPWAIWRPGQSGFFDGDYNGEGGAVKFERGMLFGTAYGLWLTEQYNANPDGPNTDSRVLGLQAGVKFPLLGGETRLAANYFECGLCQGESPLYANNANGNTTYRDGESLVNLLAYDYEILDVGAQFGTTVRDLPLTLWANYAQNMASDVEYDTAYAVGATLGKAGNPGTWEAGVFYQSLDKDALFAQLIASDFGDGKTDSEGWVLKGGYAPVKNVTLNATYLINTLNKDVGTELDYNRLQLDMNYKF
ncbi:MAG: putative porin [Steroidobacteraceae bacterium]